MSTISESAYHSIREMLGTGQLAPGQRISQVRIARTLKCSTVPVVEALRRIESEGLLEKLPRKMARVRVLRPADIEGLFLFRQSMEMAAARLCAERSDASARAQLSDTERRFRLAAAEKDNVRADQLDLEIHSQIMRGAHCPLLQQELSRLLLLERTIPGNVSTETDWERYAMSHHGIVQAICDGDADLAEVLIKKHIQVGYEQTLARETSRASNKRVG